APTFGKRPIDRQQVADEDDERPPVVDQVVLVVEEQVLVLRDSDEPPFDEREPRGVEGTRSDLAAELFGPAGGGLAALRREVAGLEEAGREFVDRLKRPAVLLVESRPERLVPLDDPRERRFQERGVEAATETDRRLEVVGDHLGMEPLEEENPLLRVGHRELAPARL